MPPEDAQRAPVGCLDDVPEGPPRALVILDEMGGVIGRQPARIADHGLRGPMMHAPRQVAPDRERGVPEHRALRDPLEAHIDEDPVIQPPAEARHGPEVPGAHEDPGPEQLPPVVHLIQRGQVVFPGCPLFPVQLGEHTPEALGASEPLSRLLAHVTRRHLVGGGGRYPRRVTAILLVTLVDVDRAGLIGVPRRGLQQGSHNLLVAGAVPVRLPFGPGDVHEHHPSQAVLTWRHASLPPWPPGHRPGRRPVPAAGSTLVAYGTHHRPHRSTRRDSRAASGQAPASSISSSRLPCRSRE